MDVFFGVKQFFWPPKTILVYNLETNCPIFMKLLEKVCYIIIIPFSNLDFLFGAIWELKFTIQIMAPRASQK